MIIRARLGNSGQVDDSVKFDIAILEPCSVVDSVSFTTQIQSFQYDIKAANLPVFKLPTINHAFAGICPLTCTLLENAPNQSTVPSITSLTGNLPGQVKVQTDNKSLNGDTYFYRLICSTKGGNSQAVNDFEVNMRDECLDTQLTAPYFVDFTATLFETNFRPIVEAQSTLICGGFIYSIESTFPGNPPVFDI